MPRFSHALLAEHTEGLVALSGCREGEIARRLRVGDRDGARAAALGVRGARFPGAFYLELSHHLLPDDDWLVTETAALADELGLPVVVTNDVHYALPEGREFQDVLTAIRHGRTLDELADLRRPDGESYLKSAARDARRCRPATAFARIDPRRRPGLGGGDRDRAASWRRRARSTSGSSSTASRASRCRTGETPFSYLVELC